MKESIKKVQNVGIIFDMDGTLWDSTENITKAWNEVLVKYGYGQLKLTVEQVSKEMGKLMRDIADSLFKDIPENIRYEIFEECLSYENEYLFKNGANVYDGVEDVFKELNKKYKEEGLEILGFPCNQFANQDKGSNEEIQEFCSLNYGVTFNMFQKIEVNGENAHPLYKFLKNEKKGLLSKEIKWNFTKFLVDSEGNVVKRYGPTVKPLKIEEDIKRLLK